MPFDKQKVINIALAEEGYLEKASRSGLDSKTANAGKNNFTKYARDIDAITGFYNGKNKALLGVMCLLTGVLFRLMALMLL